MQKLLFYTKINFGNVANVGIKNKIVSQVKAFRNLGVEPHLFYFENDDFYLQGNETQFKETIKSKLHFLWFLYFGCLNRINFKEYSYLYIRHFLTNPFFLIMLWRIKRQNPKLKIFLELPTYPYKFENNNLGFISRVSQMIDSFCTIFFKYFVTQIVTFSADDSIFGIPTIKIDNGVEVEKYSAIEPIHQKGKQIHLLGLANVQFWHGFDRLIEGIKNYQAENPKGVEFIFHIVGKSDLIEILKLKVKALNLQSSVIFHGFLNGKELEKMFANCHVGISTLALHRIHLTHASPLKSREFTSRGLPFVLGHEDDGFPKDYPFILKVANDDTPVKMEQIIAFIGKLATYPIYWITMNKYAKDNFTWECKLKNVVDKFKIIT